MKANTHLLTLVTGKESGCSPRVAEKPGFVGAGDEGACERSAVLRQGWEQQWVSGVDTNSWVQTPAWWGLMKKRRG